MTYITEKNYTVKQYGITQTFRNPLERTHSVRAQYYYTRVMLSKYLGESCDDFVIYPEFTIQGRIHYHGLLTIKNYVKWVRDTLPRLRKLGFVKMETFKDNPDNWITYMKKSVLDTKAILNFKDDINIAVTKDDYKQWKTKPPTIETWLKKSSYKSCTSTSLSSSSSSNPLPRDDNNSKI